MLYKAYDLIRRPYSSIFSFELQRYLERNYFYASREDIDSILRRSDHDADTALNYEEFKELIFGVAPFNQPSRAEKSPERKPKVNEEADGPNSEFNSPTPLKRNKKPEQEESQTK